MEIAIFISISLCSLLIIIRNGIGELEPFIVGGSYATIKKFPHSAFIAVSCQKPNIVENWACGSSILNQVILLTASHCLEECLQSSYIGVVVGSAAKNKGISNSASRFVMHPNYEEDYVTNDIALVRMKKPLKFGTNVKRVALWRSPPYDEPAELAGWGLIDEHSYTGTIYLKEAKQKVWTNKDCVKVLEYMNPGSICANAAYHSTSPNYGYAAEGDSGSALIVRGHIQIGIVSYKNPTLSRSVVVFTDVAYFYDWIKKTSRYLYCSG